MADLHAAHQYSTTQLALPESLAGEVRRVAALLVTPDHVHAGEGLEDTPHVTVLYGIETDDASLVAPCCRDCPPLTGVLQGLEVWQPEGKDYDVLVQRVASPGAARLREALLAALPVTLTHPTYRAHLTLGYAQRGCGAGYAGRETGLEGLVLRWDSVQFVTRHGVCTTIPLALPQVTLEAMGFQLPDLQEAGDHPNRLPFWGVLTRLDEPSDRPPKGSQGHRVLLPTSVARKALPTLIGMAVDCSLGLTDHAAQRKIGLITEADLDGKNLTVKGILYQQDFPDAVAAIRARSRTGELGMSFEVTRARVDDPQADIWVIRDLIFTGAAILARASAAYGNTALAASTEGVSSMDQLSAVHTSAGLAVSAALAAGAEASAAPATGALAARPSLDSLGARLVAGIQGMTGVSSVSSFDHLASLAAQAFAPPVPAEPAVTLTATGMTAQQQAMTACMRAMTACMKAMGMDGMDPMPAEEHADEAQDLAMLKRLVDRYQGRATAAAAPSTAALMAKLDSLSQDLATLKAARAGTDASDTAQGKGGLCTDQNPGASGGGLVTDTPAVQRKTFSAANDPEFLKQYQEFVGKYQLDASSDLGDDKVLAQALSVITDPLKRLEVKIELDNLRRTAGIH